MRELDPTLRSCAIVGAGRLGRALAAALPDATGPLSRGEDPAGAALVILCVPDSEIAGAAAAIERGPLVGHCSGATTLAPIVEAGHEAFSMHPLMTVPDGDPTALRGAFCAAAGSSEKALHTAEALGIALGMTPITIDDEDRAAYHAAAAIASNFLITIEAAAERLAATTNLPRAALLPLVRATVETWAQMGAEKALTGPIARGDEATVAGHRATIGDRCPELLPLYDAMAQATRELAAR